MNTKQKKNSKLIDYCNFCCNSFVNSKREGRLLGSLWVNFETTSPKTESIPESNVKAGKESFLTAPMKS